MVGSKEEFIEKFKERTKQYSLQAIKIFKRLPKSEESAIIRKTISSICSIGWCKLSSSV